MKNQLDHFPQAPARSYISLTCCAKLGGFGELQRPAPIGDDRVGRSNRSSQAPWPKVPVRQIGVRLSLDRPPVAIRGAILGPKSLVWWSTVSGEVPNKGAAPRMDATGSSFRGTDRGPGACFRKQSRGRRGQAEEPRDAEDPPAAAAVRGVDRLSVAEIEAGSGDMVSA